MPESADHHATVVVLGGNAFARPGGLLTMQGQFEFAREALSRLQPLLEDSHRIVITHGNGPQVGQILMRVEAALGTAHPSSGTGTSWWSKTAQRSPTAVWRSGRECLPPVSTVRPQELVKTIEACQAEVIVDASPARLHRIVELRLPLARVRYQFRQQSGVPLERIVGTFLSND